MTDEIFDVVNEQDEVVGQAPRRDVHARGLMHRAVHVLVFNARGQVFLQKRSMNKDKSPGLWDSSASGHVDAGESYDASAVRELREELGLVLDRPPLRVTKLSACPETDQEHVWIYRCEAEGPFELNAEEIDAGEWLSPAEVSTQLKEHRQWYSNAFAFIWQSLNLG